MFFYIHIYNDNNISIGWLVCVICFSFTQAERNTPPLIENLTASFVDQWNKLDRDRKTMENLSKWTIECVLRLLWSAVDFMSDALTHQANKLRSQQQVLDLVESIVNEFMQREYPNGLNDFNSTHHFEQISSLVQRVRNRILRMGGYLPSFDDSMTSETMAQYVDELPRKVKARFDVWGEISLDTPLRQPFGPCTDLQCLRNHGDIILNELTNKLRNERVQMAGRVVNAALRNIVLLVMLGVSKNTQLLFFFF